MNLYRVTAVLRRELQEIGKSRGLMLAIFLPPLLFTILPLIAIVVLGRVIGSTPEPGDGDVGRLAQLMPELRSWAPGEIAVFVILQQFLTFFLMMPLIVSLSIAAQSIVGEKQNKSLEPLLATPIKTGELLFAKALSAVVPGVLVTWAAFSLFSLGARLLIESDRVLSAVWNPRWLVAMLILAPLLSLLAVSLAVVVSSRVNDTRAVQQIGGFVVLPIVLLGVAQTTGVILVNALTFVIGSVMVGVLDVIILRVGVRLFQREKILTQWK